MIFASGAGAMQDAARAMRKLHNKWTKSGDGGRDRSSLPSGYEPESAGFPCAELCGTCGYFVDIDDEADADVEPDCPACGDQAWVDLEIEPVASAIREMEAEEREDVPTWIEVTVVGGPLALAASATVLLAAVGLIEYSFFLVIPALLFSVVAYFVLTKPAAVFLLQWRDRLPDRWHVPLPLPGEGRQPTWTVEGAEARTDRELLRAPISDRACIAYQVCALFDASGDARPPEWALEEQRGTELSVDLPGAEGTMEIAADDLYLESPVEFVHASGSTILPVDDYQRAVGAGVDDDAIKRFLRKRGLFITEGDFHFYEAVLEPGDRIDIEDYDGETYIVEHTRGPSSDDVSKLTESLESLRG